MRFKNLIVATAALLTVFAAPLVALMTSAFAQDHAIDQIISDACADNGQLLKWLAGIFGTSAAASLLANFRKSLPPGVLALLDALAMNFSSALRASAEKAKTTGAALLAAVLIAATLSACAGTAGQPLTQAQVQQNLDNAIYLMKAAGCAIDAAGAAAAPIVSIAADEKGQQVLQATTASGALVCNMTVPASALPVPAPASAPPATAAVAPASAS